MENRKFFSLSNYRNVLVVFALAAQTVIFTSCASKPPEAGIPSSANPREEVTKLENRMNESRLQNVDVLASKDFNKAAKELDKAKSGLNDFKDQERILDHVRFANVYLNDAQKAAENRTGNAPGLLEARRSALKAGAMGVPEIRNHWQDLDSDLASDADQLDKLSISKLSKYQERYVDFERKAVVHKELAGVQAQIKGADKDGAENRAPNTFKKAELSLKNAESAISSNLRASDHYKAPVEQAKQDAGLLTEVMEAIRANGKNISESAALGIVAQKRQIAGLQTDLSTSRAQAESEISAKDQALAARNRTLQERETELKSAQSSVAMQKAIDEARQKFSSGEAEAYQQGENLLIRLRAMHFASGRSELPKGSISLLQKVSSVAKTLSAKEIKVEGHTDSVGTAAVNKSLSEQRASTIAEYLRSIEGLETARIDSEGAGFEKPIASNKSKQGRAQNRRVDIILTPAESARPEPTSIE